MKDSRIISPHGLIMRRMRESPSLVVHVQVEFGQYILAGDHPCEGRDVDVAAVFRF